MLTGGAPQVNGEWKTEIVRDPAVIRAYARRRQSIEEETTMADSLAPTGDVDKDKRAKKRCVCFLLLSSLCCITSSPIGPTARARRVPVFISIFNPSHMSFIRSRICGLTSGTLRRGTARLRLRRRVLLGWRRRSHG